MAENEWKPINTAPEAILIDTKIDDEHGERNHAPLIRDGRLWWRRDYSMYVYYEPTHWRPIPGKQ